MNVRRFVPSDAQRLCDIFYRSVQDVASAKYTPEQVHAWAPEVPDPERWFARWNDYDTFLAEDDAGATVAWISMTGEGYIDMLFCLPEATRRGYAIALYDAVEALARERGLQRMWAHASLLAQPFFMRRGWQIDRHEIVERRGVDIPRAEMSKTLL